MAEFKVGVSAHNNGTYSLGISLDHGFFSPDDMIAMAEIAKRHGVERLMATTAKKINYFDVKEEEVNALWDDLLATFGDRLRTPKGKIITCPGYGICKMITPEVNPHEVSDEITAISKRHNAGKVKVGISGCPRGCAMPQIRDIGVFATARGWTVSYGGNGGSRPAIGVRIAEGLNHDDMLALVEKLYVYTETQKKEKDRTARIVERNGKDHLMQWLEEN